ncbi:MAG: hypothetical protein IKA88_06835 [Clostridia bacterium]|nr:hypothetical protein [Clostridia bacterium]
MEIFVLVLLYYLSQNPNFAESVKPLMSKLKDSEQMLGFLNDLSKFSQTFGASPNPAPKGEAAQPKSDEDKKTPQSPTSGIADEFIENILENYLKKR